MNPLYLIGTLVVIVLLLAATPLIGILLKI